MNQCKKCKKYKRLHMMGYCTVCYKEEMKAIRERGNMKSKTVMFRPKKDDTIKLNYIKKQYPIYVEPVPSKAFPIDTPYYTITCKDESNVLTFNFTK